MDSSFQQVFCGIKPLYFVKDNRIADNAKAVEMIYKKFENKQSTDKINENIKGSSAKKELYNWLVNIHTVKKLVKPVDLKSLSIFNLFQLVKLGSFRAFKNSNSGGIFSGDVKVICL